MSIKDFAEKVIKAEEEAFQKGNFDLLKALEDPDVVYHVYQRRPYTEIVGHEAHKQDIVNSSKGRVFTKFEFQYLTGEGNLFALSIKINGGNFLFVGRVKKGKVIEGWVNGNTKVSD
ncbi:MAG: hypothetical protein A2Z29_09380 [Chloroflexi bacterium RBG_16_56_11]|nr:MAG: hypothetical protein A2Z29_09380 [Chloroflexi bacterium RBG_16_56_11]